MAPMARRSRSQAAAVCPATGAEREAMPTTYSRKHWFGLGSPPEGVAPRRPICRWSSRKSARRRSTLPGKTSAGTTSKKLLSDQLPETSASANPLGEREFNEVAMAALRTLPREQREIVALKIWGGQTFREIGVTLDIPQNTAASRYRYALKALGQALAKNQNEDSLLRAK